MLINPNEIIREYGGGVYTLAMRLCRNRFDADDLFQATFLKVSEKGSLDNSRNISAYLYTTALNLYRKQYSKAKRETQFQEAEEINLDDKSLLEEDYISKERQKCVRKCIDSLHDKYRLPVLMYYGLEWKVGDISEYLKVPDGTVKTRLKKAREIIRKRLEAEQWITLT